MGDQGRIELLLEFPPQLGDTPLRLLGKLLRRRPVLSGGDGFAGMVLKIAQNALQLFLHLANLGLLLFPAFGGEIRLLAFELLFTCLPTKAAALRRASIRRK